MTGDPPSYEPGYFPPPAAPPYPPPTKKRSKAPWIVLGVVLGFLVLLIGGCAVGIILLARNEDIRETISDLTIDFSDGVPPTGPVSCEVTGRNSFDAYRVVVSATNASGVTSAYRIDYELLGPDGRSIGTDFGIIARVEPGETVDDNALGTLYDDPDWTQVSCEVQEAVRVSL